VSSHRARALIIHQLASAVAHCVARGVRVVVHPAYIHVVGAGVIFRGVDAAKPDLRFDPPEDEPTAVRRVAWAVGCVLFKLVKGRAPVPPNTDRACAIVRCLGAPTVGECLAMGIPPRRKATRRAPIRGATGPELAVLRATLTWHPDAKAACTRRGLALLCMDPILETLEDYAAPEDP
jgi:hypothetical protein